MSIDPAPGSHVLATIDYGGISAMPRVTGGPHFHVANRQLGSTALIEMWTTDQSPVIERRERLTFCKTDIYMAGYLENPLNASSSLESAVNSSMQRLLELVREQRFARLLRVWNYVPAINSRENGLEQYQQFCLGRHDAFVGQGLNIPLDAPAATAVGGRAENLAIFFLATTEPVMSVENPRQISAFRYPQQYGPRSPSFSRALLTKRKDGGEQLYVSGTASVVGHESRHKEVASQTEETLLNLRALIEQARRQHRSLLRWTDATTLKIYLRNAEDFEPVERIVAAAFPTTAALYLEADICRHELKVEIEGVWNCKKSLRE